MKFYLLTAAVFTVASAQQYTTPVPILKQINKHNEDGSYSYGYEAADGTYKIETKYPNGEVFGKYGYIDDQGQIRTVEYGASRRGFEPTGNEIQVPPPTLKTNYPAARPLGPEEEDDGQYREDPSVYYKNNPYAKAQPRYPQSIYSQPSYPQSIYSQDNYPQSIYRQPSYDPLPLPPKPTYQPTYQPPAYRPQPAFRPQPSYNDYNSYNNYNNNFGPSRPTYYNPPPPPAHPNYHPFQGHPATNVDIWSGSYSVNYRR